MKFSGNLFKIQAKMSLSAFVLMGSVCHLGAMEGDEHADSLSNGGSTQIKITEGGLPNEGSAGHVSRAVYLADVRDRGREEVFTQPKRLDGDVLVKFGRLYDEQLAKPDSPIKLPNKREAQARADALRCSVRERLARRRANNAELSKTVQVQTSSSQQEILAGHDVKVSSSAPNSPGFNDIYSPQTGVGLGSPDVFLSRVSDFSDADEEVTSPGVSRREEMERKAVEGTSTSSDMIVHGERLDFSNDADQLVVYDEQVSSHFADSILAARPEDKITLKILKKGELVDVETSISDLLKPVAVDAASNALTKVKTFFQYLKASKEERPNILRKLKKKSEYADLTDSELADRIEKDALDAFSEVPDFLLDMVRQSKTDKSALTLYVEGAQGLAAYVTKVEQQNIILRKQAVSLNERMMSSLDAFNNAFSAFGLKLQGASDVDGAVTHVQQIREEHRQLEKSHSEIRENYTELASVNAGYIKKMDADRDLIDQLYSEKRALLFQLDEVRAEWKLREAELLTTIESLRSAGNAANEPQKSSVKAAAQAPNQKGTSKSSVPNHVVNKKTTF